MRLRLDVAILERGLATTRARAQALIRAGDVEVDGQVMDKPGMTVPAGAEIVVRQRPAYVGRGGQKLAAGLDAFGLDPRGRTCLDVGASTGGFTDVLLQRGAARVFAVDVGRGQLAWKLRSDPRVVNLERTDIRAVGPLEVPIELAVVDVAFISLRRVLPAIRPHLAAAADVVALVKPQFEAGRAAVGRGGVVRDPAVHHRVLADFLAWAEAAGWAVAGARASPITGADGNREFLVHVATPAAGRATLPAADALAAALGDAGAA